MCTRRDLCPFGNSNNNKIFTGTVLSAFILHYQSKIDIPHFSGEVPGDQADERNLHKAVEASGYLN